MGEEKGAKRSLKEGNKLQSKADNWAEQSAKGVTIEDANDIKWGADYYPNRPDEQSTILEKKKDLLKRLNEQGAAGFTAGISDDDVRVEMRQDARALSQMKDTHFYKTYLRGVRTPAELAFAQKLNPNYFKAREQKIEKWCRMQEKFAKLQLFGVQSEEDAIFQFEYDAGYFDVPQEVVFAQKYNSNGADQFERGKFNPRRYLDKAINAGNRYDGMDAKTFRRVVPSDRDIRGKWGEHLAPGI